VDKVRLWLQSLSQQQRVLALVFFLAVFYFIWTIVWESYYTKSKAEADGQIAELQEKIKVISTAQERVKALRSDPDILATQKKLEELREQLQQISRRLVSSKQMLDQLKGVFAKDPEIKFTHIQNMGSIPFSLEETGKEPNKKNDTQNPATVAVPQAPFYQHVFEISFTGNYFATQRYLQQLEKLPGQLYFDSIDYQVQKYPLATVTLKVHTISLDEGLLDA
jgi:MSHA biogenesis protein MshJ